MPAETTGSAASPPSAAATTASSNSRLSSPPTPTPPNEAVHPASPGRGAPLPVAVFAAPVAPDSREHGEESGKPNAAAGRSGECDGPLREGVPSGSHAGQGRVRHGVRRLQEQGRAARGHQADRQVEDHRVGNGELVGRNNLQSIP